MQRIANCALLIIALLLPAFQLAIAAPSNPAPGSTRLSKVEFTTLRAAVKSKQVTFKLSGDGSNTKSLKLTVTNTTNHPINVVVPAHEAFLSKNPSIQNMMAARDRVMSLPANGTVEADIPTFCVSTKTIPPPGAEGGEFDIGIYPDSAIWKDVASIIEAARLLNSAGDYATSRMIPAERREGTIAQLAIWFLLGKRSGKPEDQVNADVIMNDLTKQLVEAGQTITDDQKAAIKPAVDQLFAMVDLTVKKGLQDPHTRELATVPTDSTYDTFMQVGLRTLSGGNVVEAGELLAAAVDEAQSFGKTDKRLANSHCKLGECYLYQGRPEAAQPQFSHALNIYETTLGPDFLEVAEAATGLAESLILLSKIVDAVPLFERALQIREKSMGKDSSLTGESANNLACAYAQLNREGEAESMFARALATRIKANGLESLEVAEVNKNLGDLYTREGNYPKAESLYKRALTVDQKLKADSDPYLCSILDGLANLYKAWHKPAEADDFLKRSDELKEKLLGATASLITAVPVSYVSFDRLASLNAADKKIAAAVRSVGVGTSASAPGSSVASAANKPVRDKWALVVGISNFQTRDLNLKYSAKDAQDFANFLVKEQNFRADHVHVLLDEKATRESIIRETENWLGHAARPDDLVVVYVSSHGSPSSMGGTDGVNFLVAYNTDRENLVATGLDMSWYCEKMKSWVQSDRIVMVLDACHSAGMNFSQPAARKDLVRRGGFNAEAIAQGTGQMVICSSGTDQSSWEGKQYQNGIFTHNLIEQLREAGIASPVDDVFIEKLSRKVCDESIRDWGEKQTPVMKSRWRGGRLILGTPATDPVRVLPPSK